MLGFSAQVFAHPLRISDANSSNAIAFDRAVLSEFHVYVKELFLSLKSYVSVKNVEGCFANTAEVRFSEDFLGRFER